MTATTDTNTTYALIDTNSGLVWGVTEATGAENACYIIDMSTGGANYDYTEHSPNSDLGVLVGYYVYAVPADKVAESEGWECDDQDALKAACGEPIVFIERTQIADPDA